MEDEKAKEYIKHLYDVYQNADSEIVQPTVSGAINRLQKAFPKRGHFLMEFIQNSDDSGSELLKIEIDDKSVKVYNSGNVFAEKDVKSICQVGQSSKTPEDYVGYLGVGFKSVFLISDEPHIYSGPFKFKFDKKYHQQPDKVPWQVMPIWDDKIPSNTEVSWWNTSFYLPFNYTDQTNIEKIRDEIETESINSRLLLFLRHLRQVEINNKTKNIKKIMKKSKIIESNENYEIYELIDEQNGQENSSKWLVFRNQCKVPEEVKKDNMTIEWERQKVQKREIVAAFKLDENDELIEEKGAAHIGVFSFLPIKEDIEGISFLIQGDFLTAPGRETLSRDALWNKWLCLEISKFIKEKCVPIFTGNKKWKMRFADILYSPNYTSSSFFDIYLKKELANFINTSKVLVTEDESLIKISEAIRMSDEVRELIDQRSLSSVFPNKKILHQDCWTNKIVVENSPNSLINALFHSDFSKVLTEKAEEKDVDWFISLYKKLFEIYKVNKASKEEIKISRILLTNDFELSEASKTLLPKQNIPIGLEHNFKLIHPELMKYPDVLDFFKDCGVREVTDELIRQLMNEKQIPEIARAWGSISEEEKLKHIQFIFKMWKEGKIKTDALSFLTLKSKEGNWEKPSNLKFGNEYSPEINLEKIIQNVYEKIATVKSEVKDAITQKIENDFNFNFISPSLPPQNDDNVKWIDFLKELGVDRYTDQEKRDLINRLSVIFTLIFEDREGRTPRELTETEKRGYDVISKGQPGIKIEVKGSEKSSPNLFLSPNEYDFLLRSLDSSETYWCYMVIKVLGNAELYRMKGEDIKNESPGINLSWKQIRKIGECSTL
jgi:hypothetical protein